MHGLMRRCKETGLKLNPDKCKMKEKIKFYDIKCSENGVQLQTFLGVATYMGPFILN